MSISMTGITGYATLSRLIADSSVTHRRLDVLTNQVSTGLIGDTYAGLGAGASVSLSLGPQIANLHTWQNNVDAATGRMGVAQSALTQIQSIASYFYTQLNAVDGVNAGAVDSIAASARDALGQVANALNTKDGDVYVFAGQDTANPPVPNEANILKSGYFTAINTAVAGFTGTPPNDAATVANTTYGVATSNAFGTTSPFSDFLSQPSATVRAALPVVQIGQSQTETVGLPASANGLMPDTPPGTATLVGGPVSSTGSYMRDIMRALATIGSLSSAQAGAPGFQDLVQDTRVSLTGAITSIAQDAGALGNVQTSLKATQSQLGDTETALTGQVSSAEQVDMAATLSQLSLVQTQMQASYQLISTLNSMSLVKFLPVG